MILISELEIKKCIKQDRQKMYELYGNFTSECNSN